MKNTIKFTLVLCLFFFRMFPIFAQPGNPPDPGASNPVPIAGIEYLVVAGALFGVKKIYDKRK